MSLPDSCPGPGHLPCRPQWSLAEIQPFYYQILKLRRSPPEASRNFSITSKWFKIFTWITARCTVWGIHLKRDQSPLKNIPFFRHLFSIPSMRVSLFEALSIMKARIFMTGFTRTKFVSVQLNICGSQKQLTRSWMPYIVSVSHTASAIFSPVCSPISSRKSIKSSSGDNVLAEIF